MPRPKPAGGDQKGRHYGVPGYRRKCARGNALDLLDNVVEVLQSIEQDYDPLWGSTLKQAIRRVYPGFNEGYYGYGSFSDLLEDMQQNNLIEAEYDDARRNWKVRIRNK